MSPLESHDLGREAPPTRDLPPPRTARRGGLLLLSRSSILVVALLGLSSLALAILSLAPAPASAYSRKKCRHRRSKRNPCYKFTCKNRCMKTSKCLFNDYARQCYYANCDSLNWPFGTASPPNFTAAAISATGTAITKFVNDKKWTYVGGAKACGNTPGFGHFWNVRIAAYTPSTDNKWDIIIGIATYPRVVTDAWDPPTRVLAVKSGVVSSNGGNGATLVTANTIKAGDVIGVSLTPDGRLHYTLNHITSLGVAFSGLDMQSDWRIWLGLWGKGTRLELA